MAAFRRWQPVFPTEACSRKKAATPKSCGQATTLTTRGGCQSAPLFGGVTPLR